MRRLNVMLMTDVTGRGGAEKALVDIALRLDPRRFNVLVCATRSAGNYQPILDAARVRTVVQGRGSRWDLSKWWELVRLMRREKIDVLHAHLFGSITLARLLGRAGGVPVIIAHEHWSTKAKKEVWVDRALYRFSDRVLVPSMASKSTVMQMEGIPARQIEVLYNGVDTTTFAPPRPEDRRAAREELGIPEGSLVIGVVGRLSPEKGGVDVLIRAAARLAELRPQVRLLVVGDGALRDSLEKEAERMKGRAIFTGTRIDVARLLGAMDLFVLPSLHEALPIVVLEAMSVGLPVIATEVGGVPEIVADGKTGLLVPPGDEDALYAALLRLADNEEVREQFSKAGQEQVARDFTIERMVSRVESLYGELMRAKTDRLEKRTHSTMGNRQSRKV